MPLLEWTFPLSQIPEAMGPEAEQHGSLGRRRTRHWSRLPPALARTSLPLPAAADARRWTDPQ